MGPAKVGVPAELWLKLAPPPPPLAERGGEREDELESAVGEMSGDVLILIWMLFGVPGVVVVGKKRVPGDVMSRGSLSVKSHFLLWRRPNREKVEILSTALISI